MIEHRLRKMKLFNDRSAQLSTGRLISGKDILALLNQTLKNQKETIVNYIIFFYLITIAPLVIIDGRLTALGIKKGYYQGELNPLINCLFSYFSIDTVFMLRAIFIIIAVAFLVFAYYMYPEYIKKYYVLLTVSLASYLIINILHIWVFIISAH